MKNWGKTVVAGLLLLSNAAGLALAETKDTKVPVITSDQCSNQPDKNRVRRCEVTYSDGSTDIYWVKNQKIYWHYPINDRVPSGGEYRSNQGAKQ